MKLKKGVILAGLKIEMRPVLKRADGLWRANGQELVITSGLEGTHSAGSYHYYGYALDLRTNYFSEEKKRELERILQHRLAEISSAYQVVLERTHMHVEFDVDEHLKASRSHLDSSSPGLTV